MKRVLIVVLVVAASFLCQELSARSYMGGSFSIAGYWNKDQGGSLGDMYSLSLSPEFGWLVGERWAVGFKPTVGFSSSSSGNSRNFLLGISPYARYRFLELKKFGLWAEGNANFRYVGSSYDSGAGNYSLSYGIGIRPLITYDLTENVSLYGAVNLFSLSLQGNSIYRTETASWFNSFSFGFSGQSEDVIDSLSQISIGFVYCF